MELVSQNSEADLKKREASARFDAAMEGLAINLLRVIAGAGHPGRLLHEMHDCLAAASVYRDAHGHYPDGIASLLDARRYEAQQRERWSADDEARWEADGTFMVDHAALLVRIASLRIVAAQWAGHRAVLSNSENAFHDAVRRLEDARAERRRKRALPMQTTAKPKGPGRRRDRPS